ncbi:hypothetical protein I3842_14G111000 [Carya illinoinensis]|uniref:Uncharacterized protein n=1 Tax=Carya illinoinensis TaxID=32201 RepID=A0A922ALA7_CARIL|nr:hypothetical protein I3842_14G111000 [Carya illinoinensis]
MYLRETECTFNVLDFLGDIVSKVPDLGGSDAAGEDLILLPKEGKLVTMMKMTVMMSPREVRWRASIWMFDGVESIFPLNFTSGCGTYVLEL